MRRHQKVLADPPAQLVHPVEELREVRMQPGRQDLVDARELQIGLQSACLLYTSDAADE